MRNQQIQANAHLACELLRILTTSGSQAETPTKCHHALFLPSACLLRTLCLRATSQAQAGHTGRKSLRYTQNCTRLGFDIAAHRIQMKPASAPCGMVPRLAMRSACVELAAAAVSSVRPKLAVERNALQHIAFKRTLLVIIVC